jgi:hypothetical protein
VLISPGYDMPPEDIRRHHAQEHQDILPLIQRELGLQDLFREVHPRFQGVPK